MRNKITKIMAAIALLVALPLAAVAHTNNHNHGFTTHGIVADGLLVGHNSTLDCTNGPFNWDNRREVHDHYSKKNSSDYWRYGHSYVALSTWGAGICGP